MNNGSSDTHHSVHDPSSHQFTPTELHISTGESNGTSGIAGGGDNPTAAGFDTGPSFSEARKAFLSRANNPTQGAAATSPNADSGSAGGIQYRKQPSGQNSNRNSAIYDNKVTMPAPSSNAPHSNSPRNSLYEQMGKGAGHSSAFEPVGKLKTSESNDLKMSSSVKGYSNGDSGFTENNNSLYSSGLKRDNSDSTIASSDMESVAPQSSVYSADLAGRQGSEMTINSGQFSLASSVASTPMHMAAGGQISKQKYQSMESVGANEVGLRELSNQIRRRFVRDQFRFNVMVVGETGLGKSTFINTLFYSTIYPADPNSRSSQSEDGKNCVVPSCFDRWNKTVKESNDKQNIANNSSTAASSAGSKPKSSYGSSVPSKGPSNPLVTPMNKLASQTSPKPDDSNSIGSTSGVVQWSVNDFQCVMTEGNAKMTLGLIDTPGFAQFLDNSKCSEPLVEYINKQFDRYMTIESQIDRSNNKENSKYSKSSTGLSTKLQNDPRVHCCIYFLSPQNPHRLKAVDVEAMKSLGDKVNLIPVIAKADTLTPEELKDFKAMVLKELDTHGIKLFQIPEVSSLQQQLDPELGPENKKYKSLSPFAVCGSNHARSKDGLRVREYAFGTVEIENEAHNDFVALRSILMQIHTWNLIDSTREQHYEKYRSSKLASTIGSTAASAPGTAGGKDASGKALGSNPSVNKGPLAILSEEKKAHEERLSKMQDDMQRVFEQKVAEKERRLKMKEDEMLRKHEEMNRNLEAQQAALAAAKDQHERNLQAWTESTAAAVSAANQNAATLGYPGEAEGNSSGYGTLKDKKKKLFGR
ncbi:protein peanut-like isoform X2 [Symsagittifera roscoffensis]|uniref:protein peanut-like isoform X2 n=1 Tax=Symsagittifera roscoffensis TaxID=84072 RepID=UPI00307CB416